MPHAILFKEAGFFGDHKHVLEPLKNLNVSVDDSFNDKTQSFWILDGDWQFFQDWNFETPYPLGSKSPVVLGPGPYRNITQALGPGSDKNISSLRPVQSIDGVWAPIPQPAQPGPVIARKNK
jgi:Beta/Gamma crystallin